MSIMRFRYRALFAIAVLALPSAALAQPDPPRRPNPRVIVQQGRDRDAREEQRETITKNVRLGGNGILDISNLSGNIEIRRGGGNEAVIEITKIARGRTAEEAREMLGVVGIEVQSRGERVEIKTHYPTMQGMGGRRNISVSVNFNITAPQNTRVRANTLSGNVKATDIRGELSMTTTSGNVEITNAARVTAAKSTSGNVQLTNVDSDAGLEVGTLSGRVLLRDVKARRIQANCISGEVIVHNVETDRLDAQTVSGNVQFSGMLAKAGRYELKTHSGNVRAEVAGGTGFELDATTFSGTVQSDFNVEGAEPVVARGGRRKALRGTVGNGSAVLNVTTFSGNVYVVKR
jgi:DUF4097 and DUF4098 domain-containing protein YvlB